MKYILFSFLLIFSSTFLNAQSSPEQIIDKFFKDYETIAPDKTLDNLYKHMPWVDNIKSDIDKLKTQFAGLQNYFGKYNGYAVITKRDIAGTFIAFSYLVKYDKQPVRFMFKFYKPKDTYLLYSFSYDMNLEEEVEQSMKLQNLK